METVRFAADKIRKLEIQGARNVAIAAVKSVQAWSIETKTKTREAFVHEFFEARDTLVASRATEPLMRNGIKWIQTKVEESKHTKVMDLARVVSSSAGEFLRNLEASREYIAEIGAKRIRDGSAVFTHCHSSTVTCMLAKAKQNGKAFEVICTETRPAFQGRITAKEMIKIGVKTTFIVDSAARSFMKQADIVVVGADAITSEGNIINKIGTATIALLAHEARVPFYVASELLKFNPVTMCGEYEEIEQRGKNEVWDAAPDKLIVRNPAFEVTRRDFIHGLICEEGIIPPHSINEVMRRKYPWILA